MTANTVSHIRVALVPEYLPSNEKKPEYACAVILGNHSSVVFCMLASDQRAAVERHVLDLVISNAPSASGLFMVSYFRNVGVLWDSLHTGRMKASQFCFQEPRSR